MTNSKINLKLGKSIIMIKGLFFAHLKLKLTIIIEIDF